MNSILLNVLIYCQFKNEIVLIYISSPQLRMKGQLDTILQEVSHGANSFLLAFLCSVTSRLAVSLSLPFVLVGICIFTEACLILRCCWFSPLFVSVDVCLSPLSRWTSVSWGAGSVTLTSDLSPSLRPVLAVCQLSSCHAIKRLNKDDLFGMTLPLFPDV